MTTIEIQARGWPAFLSAFGVLRTAGVNVTATGGNRMRVPVDTDRAVLRAVAATGADVYADLTESAAAEPQPDAEGATAAEPESGPAPTADDDSPEVADSGEADEQASKPAEATAAEAPTVKPTTARKAARPRTRRTKEQ